MGSMSSKRKNTNNTIKKGKANSKLRKNLSKISEGESKNRRSQLLDFDEIEIEQRAENQSENNKKSLDVGHEKYSGFNLQKGKARLRGLGHAGSAEFVRFGGKNKREERDEVEETEGIGEDEEAEFEDYYSREDYDE